MLGCQAEYEVEQEYNGLIYHGRDDIEHHADRDRDRDLILQMVQMEEQALLVANLVLYGSRSFDR